MNEVDGHAPVGDDAAKAVMKPVLPAWYHWWPVLLGPAMVAVIYLYDPNRDKLLFSRHWQDNMYVPYGLTLAACAAATVRGIKGNKLMWLVAAMAFAIFNREVHWQYSSILAYATLIATCVAGRHWYHVFGPYLSRGRVAQWLIMSAVAYVFAVALAKGWIKHLVPNNDLLRDNYEETCENLAHLMLLFTALFTGRNRP